MYEPGDTLGGYRLLKECGSGAFGSVFLAENETTRQQVALKILPKTGRRCEKELAALIAYQEKCRHANLMRIYHIGQTDDCLFYTMDAADPLEPGGDYLPDTLGNRLRRRKRLAPGELHPMLEEILDGLEILHGAGLLHRDIKPDNILWVAGRAVLGDIGLVTATGNASFAGTRGFISPAVWKGERNFAAQDDLYALAMTLYCALTGNEPKGNLELPLSLTLGGCGDLLRTCYAVMAEDSPIHTVADFRALLRKSRETAAKRRRKRFRLACVIALLLCSALCFFLLPKIAYRKVLPERNTVPSPVGQKAPSARLPESPQHRPTDLRSRQVARLTAILEREWRDNCRERLKKAGEIVVSPLNIGQGTNSCLSYGERRKREVGKALLRENAIRRQIEEEEKYQLPRLRSFAELAIRYFGDVADADASAAENGELLRGFADPDFLLRSYGDTLCRNAFFGLAASWRGELAELNRRLAPLPPDERRARLRRIGFEALRRNYLNGATLMTAGGYPERTFPPPAEAEGRLALLDRYIAGL